MAKQNGGYVIISLKSPTIYEDIESNLYKPILLTDIVIDGVEKNDVFTQAEIVGTDIVFNDIYDNDISIKDTNEIHYTKPVIYQDKKSNDNYVLNCKILKPNEDNSGQLGSSSKNFKGMYVTTIYTGLIKDLFGDNYQDTNTINLNDGSGGVSIHNYNGDYIELESRGDIKLKANKINIYSIYDKDQATDLIDKIYSFSGITTLNFNINNNIGVVSISRDDLISGKKTINHGVIKFLVISYVVNNRLYSHVIPNYVADFGIQTIELNDMLSYTLSTGAFFSSDGTISFTNDRTKGSIDKLNILYCYNY